ncbi:MAG TPA: acyltransferase [Ilumatobacter sp.]
MTQGIAGRGYVPALDGLRAFAVLGVLAFHDSRLSGGFLGVDLFFALSGFLITSLLLDEHARTGSIDLVGFWGRRLRRLLPAVLTLLVVTVVAYRVLADAGEWIVARRDAPWAQFYVANWHLAGGDGYWNSFAAPSAFEHLWSLAIEEQFYLVWPVVVFAVLRWGGPRALAATATAGGLASALAMILVFDGGDPTRVYMGTDTRAFSLLAGAAFAAPAMRGAMDRFVSRRPRLASAVLLAVVAVLGAMWVVASGTSDWLFRGGLPVHAGLSGLLAAMVVAGAEWGERLFCHPGLVWIGRLSYSLYLWHWPVFVYCSPERTGIDGWSLTAVRMAVAAGLSVLSYVLVEQPIRYRVRWAHGGRGRVTFAASTVALVVIWIAIPIPATTNAVDEAALAAVLGTAGAATPATGATTVPATTVPATTVPAAATATTTTSTTTSTTTTTIAPGPPVASVLWYGDSIAVDSWPPLSAALAAAGIEAASGAFPGVGLIPRDALPDPFGLLEQHIDEADPDLVVMQLSLWDGYESSGDQVDAFDRLGALLTERDLRLALVTLPVRSPRQADPGEPILVANARAFAAEFASRVVLLDQTEVFGSVFRLDVDGDGNPERKRDGVHLCPTGALAVTLWLLGQFEQHYAGFAAPDPAGWALGDWRSNETYDQPPGACAPL